MRYFIWGFNFVVICGLLGTLPFLTQSEDASALALNQIETAAGGDLETIDDAFELKLDPVLSSDIKDQTPDAFAKDFGQNPHPAL